MVQYRMINIEARKSIKVTDLESIVTDRTYTEVIDGLSIPENLFEGKKTLSIGEGLSDFANGLADNGFDIVAVDRIYHLGDKVLNKTKPNEYTLLDKNTSFKSYKLSDNKHFDPPNKSKVNIGAADANALPFDDGRFQLVVSNRLFEHINMSKALPEMLRVLDSNNGEVRMGDSLLHCIPVENILTDGSWEKLTYDYEFIRKRGFKKSLEYLSDNQPDVSFYIVVGILPRSSQINDFAQLVKTLIFVKGDKVPEITSHIKGDNENMYSGRLYKVDINSLEMTEVL